MIFDGLILMALGALCLAGWKVGLINSWRGPIAMVVATIVTQQFYIDFGTWIAQQTLFTPDICAFLAYGMMWVVADIVTELCMTLVLTWGSKNTPKVLDRFGGVFLAVLRWSIICTFPLMAMYSPSKIPQAPKHDDGLINPWKDGFQQSPLVGALTGFSKSMLPGLGCIVVSNKEPSFKPNFDRQKVKTD